MTGCSRGTMVTRNRPQYSSTHPWKASGGPDLGGVRRCWSRLLPWSESFVARLPVGRSSDRDGGSGSDNQDTTFTTSELVGFDGHTTSGVASFTETSTGGELTIELQPEDVGDGFIQAWLLDEDTGGMVALGVVDGDTGTFAVPKDLDLDAFNQIDISLEPYDGDPQHSAVSLARGPLP